MSVTLDEFMIPCDDCGVVRSSDAMTTYDLGNKGHQLVSLCDKCLSAYPKKDARDWRREEHPNEFGIITWFDGSRSFIDANNGGILTDILPESDSILKCEKCTWTGLDESLVCVDWALWRDSGSRSVGADRRVCLCVWRCDRPTVLRRGEMKHSEKCLTSHCEKKFGHIDPHTLEDENRNSTCGMCNERIDTGDGCPYCQKYRKD